MMQPLVNKADLDNFKYIADSVKNETSWQQCVIEAQEFDVKQFIGDGFLYELMEQSKTPSNLTAANSLLLNGGKYVHENLNCWLAGLKAAIIYYAFARFINRQPFNFTAAGITVKESDFSTPASDKSVQRMATEAYLQAEALRDELLLFISRKSADYPLYCGIGTRGRARTFHAIGD